MFFHFALDSIATLNDYTSYSEFNLFINLIITIFENISLYSMKRAIYTSYILTGADNNLIGDQFLHIVFEWNL